MTNAHSIRKFSGRLHERLHELRTTYTKVVPEYIIEPFLRAVFEQDPAIVFKEVKSLLLEVESLAESLNDIVQQYQLEIPGENPIAYVQSELDGFKKEISEELGYYQSKLESIENGLDVTPTEDADRKIPTKFSVDTLAYFFRLLVDTDLVVQDKPKKRLYEKISANFITKEATEISPDSIKNRFGNPDQKTLDDMVAILQHLQTKAHQYQRNGVKNTKDKKKK
jgi:hypothetical protein